MKKKTGMAAKTAGLLLCAAAAAVLAGCGAGSGKEESAPANEKEAQGAAESVPEGSETEAETDGTADKEKGSGGQVQGASAEPVDQRKVYVSPEWVKSVIDGGQEESEDYVILECAWGEEEDDPAYGEGHIQGAFHMNTDSVESEEYWNIRTPEEIEALLLEYGITKDTTVICYGADGVVSADDRIAFALLWAGVENVKCLDGGLAAWTEAGYGTETGSCKPEAAEAFGTEVPAHPEYILSIDQVKEKLAEDENFRLVSIRSEAEFLGETSGYGYIDRAGEPKGAIWGHDTDDGSYCREDGSTVGIDVLEGYLAESGASMENELSFYCGTGWRAAIPFLICYENGYDNVTMYDGGWYQWQMDDSNPVQVGDPKSGDCVYTTVGELPTDRAGK